MVSNDCLNDRDNTLGSHYGHNNEGSNEGSESEGVVVLEQKRRRMDTDSGFHEGSAAGSSPMIVEGRVSSVAAVVGPGVQAQ